MAPVRRADQVVLFSWRWTAAIQRCFPWPSHSLIDGLLRARTALDAGLTCSVHRFSCPQWAYRMLRQGLFYTKSNRSGNYLVLLWNLLPLRLLLIFCQFQAFVDVVGASRGDFV